MDISTLGRILLIVGAGIALLGGLLLLVGRMSGLSRFFEATTLRVEGTEFTCFAPIGLMILVSIVFSILANIIIRLLNRP
jgi:ABC-type glucose/galactose transport system permease subunit